MKKLLKALIVISLTLSLSLGIGVISSADAESEYAEEIASVNENVFTRLYTEIRENTTEIFCVMTFVGSLIMAYAYKRRVKRTQRQLYLDMGYKYQ